MPNILKRFTNPDHTPYQFAQAEDLVVETKEAAPSAAVLENLERDYPLPTAKSPVDYARLQAEAIIEDAKRQAAERMERAAVDIAAELDALRETARQDGYTAGYAEGMAGAMAEIHTQRETMAVEMGRTVTVFLEKATLAREELLTQTRDELRDLSIAVAEKVVRVSLKSSGEIIARMIQGATEKLKRKERVHIYIDGCEAKGMAQVTPGLTQALSALSDHVKIVPMADDESGTCIIEMPDEIIDASVSTQISNIRDLLSDMGGGSG